MIFLELQKNVQFVCTANNYITQLTLLNTTMRSKTFYKIDLKTLTLEQIQWFKYKRKNANSQMFGCIESSIKLPSPYFLE